MIQINEHYTLTALSDCIQMKYEKVLNEVNPKTGKNKVQTDYTYHATFAQAINRFIDNEVKDCETIKEVSEKLSDLKKHVDSLFNYHTGDFIKRTNKRTVKIKNALESNKAA